MAYSDNGPLSYGGDLGIFVIPTTGTTKLFLAYSTNAKLTISNKSRDVSSKDSGLFTNKEYGRYDWTMSSDQLFALTATGSTLTGNTTSADAIFGFMLAQQKVYVAFASKSGVSPSWTINAAKKSFTGTALITKFDLTSKDGDTPTFTIDLEGDGQLTFA
jgi:predicted secreted protein